VFLLGVPLEILHGKGFMEVGNDIGRFLHIDIDVLRIKYERVGHMLAEVDIHLDLLSKLDISCWGRDYCQSIDY